MYCSYIDRIHDFYRKRISPVHDGWRCRSLQAQRLAKTPQMRVAHTEHIGKIRMSIPIPPYLDPWPQGPQNTRNGCKSIRACWRCNFPSKGQPQEIRRNAHLFKRAGKPCGIGCNPSPPRQCCATCINPYVWHMPPHIRYLGACHILASDNLLLSSHSPNGAGQYPIHTPVYNAADKPISLPVR